MALRTDVSTNQKKIIKSYKDKVAEIKDIIFNLKDLDDLDNYEENMKRINIHSKQLNLITRLRVEEYENNSIIGVLEYRKIQNDREKAEIKGELDLIKIEMKKQGY